MEFGVRPGGSPDHPDLYGRGGLPGWWVFLKDKFERVQSMAGSHVVPPRGSFGYRIILEDHPKTPIG